MNHQYNNVGILNKLYSKMNQIRHQQNLQNIQSQNKINPSQYVQQLRTAKLKNRQKQKVENIKQIDHENKKMINSIISITRRSHQKLNTSRSLSFRSTSNKSMNIQSRKTQLKKIESANQLFADRLINVTPNYKHNQHEKDYERHCYLKKNMLTKQKNQEKTADYLLSKCYLGKFQKPKPLYLNSTQKKLSVKNGSTEQVTISTDLGKTQQFCKSTNRDNFKKQGLNVSYYAQNLNKLQLQGIKNIKI